MWRNEINIHCDQLDTENIKKISEKKPFNKEGVMSNLWLTMSFSALLVMVVVLSLVIWKMEKDNKASRSTKKSELTPKIDKSEINLNRLG